MAPRRSLSLSAGERHELEQLRDTAAKPYLRERAAALLKIADGQTPAHVAAVGLLRPRDPDTVYAWLDRYQEAGAASLSIKPGRGRKPAFSPTAADASRGPSRTAGCSGPQP
jgi:hypothetical protein